MLTGGSSKIEGLVPLAEEVLQRPVRLGFPQAVTGLTDVARNPIYATAVGLLLFGKQNLPAARQRARGGLTQWTERFGAWFKGHF